MAEDGSPLAHLERELAFYRRECNDLGARLLRQQEEQSQAFREARRSRTVVKLLREAYRLGDLSTSGADMGGPMLEIVVDNAMCDRAALLREEPLGSGQFVAAQLIGLPPDLVQRPFRVRQPPPFVYTAFVATGAYGGTSIAAADIQELMGVPFILWAFDRTSGIALVLGNRSEGNIHRPFEAGDQELIEGALSVYLDVIYRKQAEAQLRLAKQAAELASDSRAALLEALAIELRVPLQGLAQMFAATRGELVGHGLPARLLTRLNEMTVAADQLLGLLDDATRLADGQDAQPLLDVEWVSLDEMVRLALRTSYVASVRRGVDLDTRLPARRISICVDRRRMQHVLQYLIGGAMRLTTEGGTVQISGDRRSDGAFDLVICSGAGAAIGLGEPFTEIDRLGGGLPITRRLVEAHGGNLSLETSTRDAVHARITLPPRVIREGD